MYLKLLVEWQTVHPNNYGKYNGDLSRWICNLPLNLFKPCRQKLIHMQMLQIRPRGYKTFFMLNSTEHEICPSNKSQITNNLHSFLLNTAEHESFSANKYENANYCLHLHIY